MGNNTSIRCLLLAEIFSIALKNLGSISLDKVPHRLPEKRGAKSDSKYRIYILFKLKVYGLCIFYEAQYNTFIVYHLSLLNWVN